MKFFLLFFLFNLNSYSVTKRCEVYGITHVPQELDCTFSHHEVHLRCQEGEFYLNDNKVTSAYHLEVEEGSTPLVFETTTLKLTVVDSSAELQVNNLITIGGCL